MVVYYNIILVAALNNPRNVGDEKEKKQYFISHLFH